MIDTIKNMISKNDLCVLSTCSDNLPNTSLMQYICDESCTKLYMITLDNSAKYKNIVRNPRVSLLIDTRNDISRKKEPIKSLTVYGRAEPVSNSQVNKNILDRIVKKYRDLTKISENENCSVIEVSAEKFLLLDGVEESRYMDV